MAIELLHKTQSEAAGLVGVDPEVARRQMQEWSQTTVLELGSVSVRGLDIPVSRGRSGGEGIACGGIRAIEVEDPKAMVEELSEEMAFKLLIDGKSTITIDGKTHELVGGKGLIPMNLRELTLDEQRDVMSQYAIAMEQHGISSYEYNKVAGDINTNHLMGDYVQALNSATDPYYRAAATGKPVELGGLETRKEATGKGVFAATIAALDQLGKESTTAALQGVGAVGMYYLASANAEQMRLEDGRPRVAVTVISEMNGTISTDHPHGFQLNDEAMKVLSDPNFKGSKLEIIKNCQDDPDSVTVSNDVNGFYYLPAECRVPAAFGNSINSKNVDSMLSNEAGTQLVVEGANNPTTLEADVRLRHSGVALVADVVANAGGVEVSIAEMLRNIQEVNRDLAPGTLESLVPVDAYEKSVQTALVENAKRKVAQNFKIMELLGTKNPRVAAVALGMARAGVLQFEY